MTHITSRIWKLLFVKLIWSILSTLVIATSEFDLPNANIYEVDESDRIIREWSKIVNQEAVIQGVNSIRLECTANHPVQWIYSGHGIPVSSSKRTVARSRGSKQLELESDAETVHKASLFINPIKEHHTGKYVCSSTEIVDLETYFYIYVPGQALFTSLNGKNIHIPKNDSKVLIPCSVSNPKAVVTLQKQIGSVLHHIEPKSSETLMYNPRHGFTIKLDELSDHHPEGVYVCTAKFLNLVRGVEYTLTANNNYNPFQTELFGNKPITPCTNHTCGDNAFCHVVDGQPTCQCEEKFIGDAEHICSLKCEAHTDCPDNKSCFTDKECRSPCIHSVTGCGIKSQCKVENHRPVCFCGEDYVGNPMQQCFTTLQESPTEAPSVPALGDSDKPANDNPNRKCRKNEDCEIDRQCRRIGSSLECVNGCQFVLCGLNSKCSMVSHNPHCSCQPGFNGDPYSECDPIKLEAATTTIPQPRSESIIGITSEIVQEPCQNPETCGPNSKCRINKRGRQRCSCKDGYLGQPPNCTQQNKCNRNRDCLPNEICSTGESGSVCVSVCGSRVCGEGAECQIVTASGTGTCTCSSGFVGDPFSKCTDVSSKIDQYCAIDNDCGGNLRCETAATYRKCKDPCTEITCPSGTGTVCRTKEHIPNCICPKGFTGNSIIGCTADFNVNSFSGRAGRSSSLCSTISCGPNSECRLLEDKPTCFCQSGYVGTPPFCKEECLSNLECPQEHACIQRRCRNACVNKCGANTKCHVGFSFERIPICNCLDGFTGNPNVGCTQD